MMLLKLMLVHERKQSQGRGGSDCRGMSQTLVSQIVKSDIFGCGFCTDLFNKRTGYKG